MKTYNVMLQNLGKQTIPIGYQGENMYTQVRVNCVTLFSSYPNASVSMVIRPPVGDIYPAVVERNGVMVIWNITSSVLSTPGAGSAQLTFTNGNEIIKTAIFNFNVMNSLVANGEPPEPYADWLEEANEALNEFGKINDLTASATTLSSDASATAEITNIDDHKNIAIGIPRGEKGDKGDKGDPATAEQVQLAVNAYLAQVITNPDSPPLDRTLSSSSAAAPADMVGDLKSALMQTTIGKNLVGQNPDVLYPVYIPVGTTFTMSTGDGSVMPSNLRLYMYDKNKNQLSDYWTFRSGTSERTVTQTAALGTAYYMRWQDDIGIPLQVEIGPKTEYEEYFPVVRALDQMMPEQINQRSELDRILNNYSFARIKYENLFDKNNVETGKYVSYLDGKVGDLSGYNATDFIPIDANSAYTIRNFGGGIVQQFALYDKNANYITGLSGGDYNTQHFTTPNNASFIRMTVPDSALSGYVLTKGNGASKYIPFKAQFTQPISEYVAHVGTNQEYQSILSALKATPDYVPIVVHNGNYDIVQEYLDYYGENYWDEYDGYSGKTDKFTRGLWLGDGRKIYFESKTLVSFNYTGNTTIVKTSFSPFATCGNCEIHGLNLTFSNCRYAIHDDFFEFDGTEIFENCVFNGKSYNGDTIGAGLGRNNLIIIDGCLFLGNTNTSGGDISYHNNGYTSNSQSKIIVKNCYGENTVKFKWYGTNTEVSECIVYGCQFRSIECLPHTVTPNETINMHMTKWNCIETGNLT